MTAHATPTDPRPLEASRPYRFWLPILAAITLFRLWAAAHIPLTEDEAYYRLWALSPQLGYFDHPPMIAWWIGAGMALVGDNPLGVRLIPCLSCFLTSLLAFDLARRLGCGPRAARRAAIWCNATFLIGAGGVLAIPDAASVPYWILTLWCLARTRGRVSGAWWAAAGLAAGLACLSKYSALFLAPGALLWLLASPGGLTTLRRPWPWVAALIAAAVFSLNVAWNAEHHWVSFVKQFGRVAPGRFDPRFELELVLGQLVLLNPLIAVFAARALPAWASRSKGLGPDLRPLLFSAAPFAAYLVLHALHDRVQAHWAAPLYPTLAIAAASAAERARPGRWLAGLRVLAAPLGLGISALILLHLALPSTDLAPGRDPAKPVRGWSDFAHALEAKRQAEGAAWVGAISYGVAAQLSAEPALRAPVLQLVERERYAFLRRPSGADLSRPGLVVDLQRRLTAERLGACFVSVRPLGILPRAGGGHNGLYGVYLVSRPRGDILTTGCLGSY